MAKYVLTEALDVDFTFAIGDKEFKFRKPTVREMRSIAKMFQGIDKETDTDKQIELSDRAMNELYSFVTPIDHDLYVGDLIQDQPIGVQNAFNDMIKKELGQS